MTTACAGAIPLSRRNFLAGAGVLAMGAAQCRHDRRMQPGTCRRERRSAKGGAAMAETGAAAAATGNEGKTMGEVLGRRAGSARSRRSPMTPSPA